MKKLKNGFTLVELLAVITIIGILTLIALPTIERITKENREKVYQQQLDNIVLSLKSWASDNRVYLPEEEGENLTITLGTLKSEGYIEYDVKNPLNDKCFDNSMSLIITKIKKNYDYSIDLDTIKEANNCEVNVDSPVIILNGNVIENVEVNSIYVDKGVIAKDKDGNDITNSVITTISGSGNAVNTSKIGNQYVISYSVTNNDIIVSVSRTVKIVDTIAPELEIPSDVVITTSTTNLDIMEGVNATDNSGETIEVVAKSNIVFQIPGKYTITYTASDSSGNTIVKKRIVTIRKIVNGIMASDLECINDTNSICPSGTKINVQVNDSTNYDFYVIKDTGTKLTLIMSENLGNRVAWIDETDYTTANNKDETPDPCSYTSCTDEGPITAINYLDGLTDEEWSNIPKSDYTYSGLDQDGTTRKYEDITRTMRARMITNKEAIDLNCFFGSCPSWLVGSTSYWTSTTYTNDSTTAWRVGNEGFLSGVGVYCVTCAGVRPVIELSK